MKSASNRFASFRRPLSVWAAGASLILVPVLHAATLKGSASGADARRGAALYQTHCTGCHSASALMANGNTPVIEGQKEKYLFRELSRISELERVSPAMHQVLHSNPTFTDPQSLRDLSKYLADQRWSTTQHYGDGAHLVRGERLFKHFCAQCHGDRASGNEKEAIPSLAGQQFGYLQDQLRQYASGHRNEVERPFADFTAGLSDADRTAIADYISRVNAH